MDILLSAVQKLYPNLVEAGSGIPDKDLSENRKSLKINMINNATLKLISL